MDFAKRLLFLSLIALAYSQPYPPASSPFCGIENAGLGLKLLCANGVIESVTAIYGLPTACPAPSTGGKCSDSGFQAYATQECVGKIDCTLSAAHRPDPCPEQTKFISAVATCTLPPGGWAPAPPCALSNVFGSHMVLQRGPQKPLVWGFAAPGTTVKTIFAGDTYGSTADDTGIWKQVLPAQPPNAVGQQLNFSCSTGESFSIDDVLFGDVHICGGQSNMQFTVDCLGYHDGYNATAEANEAANYPSVRTMTVGTSTSSHTPLLQLGAPPIMPWSIATAKTIGAGNWSATSAACWYYGRDLFDATQIPQGLISSNWGGTIIESWVDNATNALCNANNSFGAPLADGVLDIGGGPEKFVSPGYHSGPDPNSGHGVLFYAMIYPFTVGPMPLVSFIWWQGESNIICPKNCKPGAYACQQPALVASWRKYFNNTNAFFGYVEMEPWTGPAGSVLPLFREAQAITLHSLAGVGYGTAIDIGDPTGPFSSIHPRNKKLVGQRLAAAALTLLYGKPTPYLSPSYVSAVATASGTAVTVTVTLHDVPTKLVPGTDHCKSELGVPPNECGFPTILGSDGKTYNASIAVGPAGKSVVLSATVAAGTTAVASSYGWNTYPINLIYSAEGLPLQPWNKSIAPSE